ncbi:MAG: FAD-dependent monooxygenase, partial [Planctomycetota bacterium]
MSLNGMQVAVVGGGMGGLGAALCFARAGAQVQVHERADAFADVGAGIQVSQNGLRVLDALGLGTAAREVGFASQGLTLNSAQGRRVAILPGGARETLLFHRADLIALLAEAATAAGVQITFGAEVTPDAPPDAD